MQSLAGLVEKSGYGLDRQEFVGSMKALILYSKSLMRTHAEAAEATTD